jgi:hypothetical protein
VAARRPGDTPLDIYHNRLSDFSAAVERLEQFFLAISEVRGDDGRPIVDTRGADPRMCMAWREVLSRIDDELNIWGRLFRRMFGSPPEPSTLDAADDLGDANFDKFDDEFSDEAANNRSDDDEAGDVDL